ncbi:hypothetical protein [Tritonibacter mobilis]|uniref:Uncharacterized protein n=1 Tax=Tritonibacter mobilis F1926 TaxID=1265309 RepID=A0A1B1A5T0_9RHOB|nr:hypothetical protein [Tritonibacter mobilis]ANP41867.1 hypothetical protein K529_013905 [Tritonibacter mobilis F1926]KJZ26063.1 hypothetical protein TW79_02760 [Tritonibacter mobilis]
MTEARRLDSNGVLFLKLSKISTKKAAVEAFCEKPWPIRLEIASNCLTKRGILPLSDNDNLVVRPSRLGFQLTSSLEVKARIHRFIDDEVALVQRLQAPRKLGCITSDIVGRMTGVVTINSLVEQTGLDGMGSVRSFG